MDQRTQSIVGMEKPETEVNGGKKPENSINGGKGETRESNSTESMDQRTQSMVRDQRIE
jgi:hypothetical protein